MKQLIFALLFAVGSIGLNANDANYIAPQEVQVGDVFRIGDFDAPRYEHINFPRHLSSKDQKGRWWTVLRKPLGSIGRFEGGTGNR